MLDIPIIYDDNLQQEKVVNECIQEAAVSYDLDPLVLRAIREQELGDTGKWNGNSDGSIDYGVMQINSIHLGDLKPFGISARDLVFKTCVNVAVAGWHLRNKINEIGGDLWRGVGRYHSKTKHLGEPYRNKVFKHYLKLLSIRHSSLSKKMIQKRTGQ